MKTFRHENSLTIGQAVDSHGLPQSASLLAHDNYEVFIAASAQALLFSPCFRHDMGRSGISVRIGRKTGTKGILGADNTDGLVRLLETNYQVQAEATLSDLTSSVMMTDKGVRS